MEAGTVCTGQELRDSGFEDVDFLLPNGFMVSLSCDRRSSLSEIKSILWEKAVQLPAANLLRDSVHYVFIGVTKEAVEEELDDNIKVEDLQNLAKPILEVSVPKLTRDLNKLNHVTELYTCLKGAWILPQNALKSHMTQWCLDPPQK